MCSGTKTGLILIAAAILLQVGTIWLPPDRLPQWESLISSLTNGGLALLGIDRFKEEQKP
jgi:hypothetical protein